MTAYVVAKWPGEHRAQIADAALLHEAKECASSWALVCAVSRAHALRLWREGTNAVRGVDGRMERCGIVVEVRRER